MSETKLELSILWILLDSFEQKLTDMYKYYFLLSLIVLLGCHEQNNNKISPAELVKSREIKKVSEAEILKKGSEIGDKIMQSIVQIVDNRTSQNNDDCDIENWSEIDSLENKVQGNISLVNIESEGLSEMEMQLLEAYQYNLDENIAAIASVQKLDNNSVLYAYSVDKESIVYQQCMDSISRKKAAMWRILLPVKNIVRSL